MKTIKTWKNQTAADATDNSGMQIMQGGKLIATCHYGAKDTADLTGAIENARLISAAPDLLEALNNMLNIFNNYAHCIRGDAGINVIQQAVAAIAKAKGESR